MGACTTLYIKLYKEYQDICFWMHHLNKLCQGRSDYAWHLLELHNIFTLPGIFKQQKLILFVLQIPCPFGHYKTGKLEK